MDSMKSLNKSLPSSSTTPPDQLLHAFRQAALSVTNLYKSAAGSQESSRQAGYQDALVDLLKFLDRENIGLQDGEGWRIREWVTARYDGGVSYQQSDSEDEGTVTDQQIRSSSPVHESVEESQESTRENIKDHTSQTSRGSPVFQFTAGDSSNDNTMQTEETKPQEDSTISSSVSSPATLPNPVRVDVKNRGNRNALKSRPNVRVAQRSISGTKRRMPFPDFSEIFNAGFEKKDGSDGSSVGSSSSGGKRTRFV